MGSLGVDRVVSVPGRHLVQRPVAQLQPLVAECQFAAGDCAEEADGYHCKESPSRVGVAGEDTHQLDRLHAQTGLLPRLAHDSFFGRFVGFQPATGQTPAPVVGPLHEQNAPGVVKDSGVRISLGETADPNIGFDWLEEFESYGYIGRSMGPIKVPLLVANTRSLGGGSILDHAR